MSDIDRLDIIIGYLSDFIDEQEGNFCDIDMLSLHDELQSLRNTQQKIKFQRLKKIKEVANTLGLAQPLNYIGVDYR